MVDPATAMIVATAIAAAAKGTGDYLSGKKGEKSSKSKAKESKRETLANNLDQAMQRGAELEAHGLAGRKKLGKRKAQSLQETSDLVRGAFKI